MIELRRRSPAHRDPRTGGCLGLLAAAAVLPAAAAGCLQEGPPTGPVAEEIRQRVGELREAGEVRLDAGPVLSDSMLAALYERRRFRPLWTGARGRQLARLVEGAAADGLFPDHYHHDRLAGDVSAGDPAASAERDLLRSDAFLALYRDLRHGRVDPGSLDAGWHVDRTGEDVVTAELLEQAIESSALERTLDAQRPAHPLYGRMRDALADYRAIVEGGGWPKLDVAAPLARDSAGDAVAVLRRRLFLEGDLPATADTASPRFDATLEDAVRRFQQRHGLNADGVIGKRTLAELNVSAGRRVAQLRANLERARWVLRDLSDTLLAVNVAGQLAYLLVGDGVAWSSRVVVGEEYTRTPVFAASMKEVVLNPDWTVPRTINGEILASAEEDPDYLRREGFEVIDESGRALDPDELDLGGYTGETFPHTFVQRPGPTNALGRIKFMFPNRFDVYLHDTPARGLFAREDRTFSHGCIRVEDPLSLGETVLSGWPRERLEAVLREGDTRTVELDAPLPVLILYWTAATDLDGEVHFYRDIYGRDGPLIEALARPSPS